MNIKVIAYFLGKIATGIALIQLIPFFMAAYYRESCYGDFVFSIAAALMVGSICNRYGQMVEQKEVSVREGIGGVFFSWILSGLLASLPYMFSGLLDPASSIFESMSGLTTTGATTFDDLDIVPRSMLFWRVITHWVGGIGIIVLFVALLPQIAGKAMNLFNAEVTGFSNSRMLPRLRTTAITLFSIYLVLTMILTACLSILGLDVYDAVYHACSAIATGGFSPYNDSIAHFSSPMVEYTLSLFMMIAAGNFSMYYEMTQSGWKAMWHDLEFRTYVTMTMVITLLITANIIVQNGYSLENGFREALFQVASFSSTTGFVSADYDKWPAFSQLLLALTFFTGGCAGSTAGGIKICRLIVLIKTVAAELRRTLHPQMILSVYYQKHRLPIQTIINISRFFFVYIFIVALSTVLLTAGGMKIEEAIFSAASCLASVGPAFGSVGATGNFADVSGFSKIVLSVAMVLGRLELFTALALLRQDYWKKDKRW